MPAVGSPDEHTDWLQPADYNCGLQNEDNYKCKLANALIIKGFISMHS
jgi:hypothetical protein